ncbi:MAG TPA: PilZ domain-containing protein [Vicinamibacteria bacterium]|nr:PilZ domain-containing protein [Vicinamibacteria bacterium]
MGEERRGSGRVARVVEVDCHTLDESRLAVAARIADLSTGGAFLDSMNALPPGTRLALRFTAGSQEIRVAAEVVHAMPQFGMGVRFLDLSVEGRAAIEALIREQD